MSYVSRGNSLVQYVAGILWMHAQDSAEIGFRDDAFYRQLNGEEETVSVQEFDRETCLELFNDYAAEDAQRY